jgi:hypothetical protein
MPRPRLERPSQDRTTTTGEDRDLTRSRDGVRSTEPQEGDATGVLHTARHDRDHTGAEA